MLKTKLIIYHSPVDLLSKYGIFNRSFLVISLFWGCYPVLKKISYLHKPVIFPTVLKSQEHLKKHENSFRMNITFKYPLEIIVYVRLCKCMYIHIYTHLSPIVGWCLIMVNLRYLQKTRSFSWLVHVTSDHHFTLDSIFCFALVATKIY